MGRCVLRQRKVESHYAEKTWDPGNTLFMQSDSYKLPFAVVFKPLATLLISIRNMPKNTLYSWS